MEQVSSITSTSTSELILIVGGFLGGILMGKARIFSARLMLLYGVAIKMIADGVFTTITPADFKLAMGKWDLVSATTYLN